MNWSVFALIAALLILSQVVTVPAEESADFDESIVISLERGMCFGTCPVYTVSLFGNGTVLWSGEMYVETTGNDTREINPADVYALFQSLQDGGFFELNESYTAYEITDMPFVVLTVRNETLSKEVHHYHGDMSAPENLSLMEDTVDLVANTTHWIGNGTFEWGEEGEFL